MTPEPQTEDLATLKSWRRRRVDDRREYEQETDREEKHERLNTGYVADAIARGHLRPGGPCT